MAVSVSATVLGHLTSLVRSTPVSTAGATSIEVLTVNHGLGVSPDVIMSQLRTINAVVSTGIPSLVLRSWNASIAIFEQPVVNAGAVNAQYDILCQKVHSIAE
jgi:hypothetical protein